MTAAEIEAAHLAIIDVWQKSNNPVGSYFAGAAAARAALEAAEKVRSRGSNTMTVDEKLDHIIELIARLGHAVDPNPGYYQGTDGLWRNKATGELTSATRLEEPA